MEDYFKPYGDIELQRRMVSDRPRTNAFAAAIRQMVKPGDVILDVGTGTGVLAMLAARAGAKKVYAVDATDIADIAMKLVKANDLNDQIQVIRSRASDINLDQKVDLIISEWLGNGVFAEGMLLAVLDSRDRHLAPQGRILPSKVRVLLAPLDEPVLYTTEGPGFWRERIHGLDFSCLQQIELAQGRTMQIRVEPAGVLAPGQILLELDLLDASPEDASACLELEFIPDRDGVLNGFALWFEADLSESVTLDTGPFSPETHWAQTYMTFSPQIVRAGEPLNVNVDFVFDPDPVALNRYVDLRLGVGANELDYVID